MPLQPYLFFPGTAEAAIAFYKEALGAEPQMLMRYKDSPEPPPPGVVPPGFEDKVMHASVAVGDSAFMLSDDCSGQTSGFRGFALSLSPPDAKAAAKVFAALAEGGSVQMPLGPTFWSPAFGMLTDRFGVGWMINVAGEGAP
jgi:PhnB protein